MGNFGGMNTISVALRAVGWKTTYVPETLQWGLVPDTVKKHRTQRLRWTGIFVSMVSAFLRNRSQGQATMRQRAGATAYAVVHVATILLTAFSAVAIPWMLFTRSRTVVYQSPRQLQVLLYLESLSFLAALLSGFTRSRSGRSYGEILYDTVQVGLSPFRAATIIRVTISEVIGRKIGGFAPSSNLMTSNTPSWLTFWTQRVDVDLLANLSILSAHLAGGYVGLRTLAAAAQNENVFRCLFSQAGYPPFFLLWGKHVIQSGRVIPLLISSQPIWPPRESLLVRDPVSKVAYPSDEATDPQRIGAAQTFAKFALFYHCIVLVSAWWMG